MSQTCTNNGCGISFDQTANHKNNCVFHPGAPVFHEGLKGWSCCSKRALEFGEFMKIPGCSEGQHSSLVKEAKPTSVKIEDTNQNEQVQEASKESKSETIKESQAENKQEQVNEEELSDPIDATINNGDNCKRRGCGAVYEGPHSRTEACIFHSGHPVFHEGSKGWTCCPRKVLEFEEFLKIRGCKESKHRFTNALIVLLKVPEVLVNCRHDWYQTPTDVFFSIYSKNVDSSESRIEIGHSEIRVFLRMKDSSIYRYCKQLFGKVDPALSSFKFMSTKVEVHLKKADGISWASFEDCDTVTSWTTFGTSGGTGTVGAKVAHVAQDAPLHRLK